MNSKLFVVLSLAATLAAQNPTRRPTVQPAEGQAPATSRPAAADPLQPLTLDKAGFKTPESVLYDEVDDVYLVSNINGAPTAVDNNGFISRVNPDGTIATLKWIEGGKNGVTLDAPKGMAIRKNTLIVADIQTLRSFDRKTGAVLGSVTLSEASFLNDVCIASDGSLLATDSGFKPDFSDSGTDALITCAAQKPDGTASRTPSLQVEKVPGRKPNGICCLPSGARCWVTWVTGEILVDGTAGSVVIAKLPKAQLDGIVALDENTFLVSSWEGKCVYQVVRKPGKAAIEITELATDLEAPADIGYDTKRKRLLIPLFTQDKVVIWPMR